MLNTSNAPTVGTSSRNRYLDLLEQGWKAHLQLRDSGAPTVISLFAGCGGSSLGYSMAGFQELLAVEWDDNAVETFKLNFPDVPVYHGDITKLSVDKCLEMTGLVPYQLDVLDGSPPCQGFSTAGKRQMDDPRNQLFREYVRLLRGLKPKVFVMENVSGMVKGKMKLVFAEILRELKASGYRVSARLLNAMYFNVPQSRQRMIFIGVREDLGIEPSHPKAEGQPISVLQALEEIDNKTYNRPLATVATEIWKHIKPGQNGTYYRPNYYMNSVKLDPRKPSPTIPKVVSGTGGHMHWKEMRSMTMEEIRRLGSFPDGFRQVGNFETQYMRIGNSVPPLFMRSIARHIRREILPKV
jgi:DNA (cytosine-5)-methyltransferase 1